MVAMHAALQTFHPTVGQWFGERLGAPSAPQQQGWPRIQDGEHVLIAAPTGSGKTLAAFLCSLDGLLQQGDALPDAMQVLYISPLKALSNDVQKNLAAPLAELRQRDPSLPEVRVQVRHQQASVPARVACDDAAAAPVRVELAQILPEDFVPMVREFPLRYFGIVDLIYAQQSEWTQGSPAEIAENLRIAGYPESEIELREDGTVYVGGDAEVSLEA